MGGRKERRWSSQMLSMCDICLSIDWSSDPCFVPYQAASLLWHVNQRCTKMLVCERRSSPRTKKHSILFQAEVWTMMMHCQLTPPSCRLGPQGRLPRIKCGKMKWVLLFSHHITWHWHWSNDLACQSWSRRRQWSSTCQSEIKGIYIISCFLPWISHIIMTI